MFWRILKRNKTSRSKTRLAAISTTRPAILSRVAGIPAGLRQTRRGSFLIMVVGTLALLSVITVIYVSVGRSDSQTSAAALKHEVRDNAPEQIRDYIAGIIAADLFDTVYLGERDENGDPIFRREAWDYPSTAYSTIVPVGSSDRLVQIVVAVDDLYNLSNPRLSFTPTGNGTGTDPWLASSEPTLLNFDGTGLTGETMPADYYLERLDWLNLSNVAPDGSFVNLYNLRGQTIGGVSRGNFDATPWEMRGATRVPPDGNSANARLTLFEDTPEVDNTRAGTRDFGGAPVDSDLATALPADWTFRQRWAVFPKVEPQLDPGDPNYLLYQYADADGDGILDSRWFEMVEDRNPADDFSRQLLDQDDRLRYFVATRIIDLSGRVNVNTATDSTLAPVAEDPYGLNPSAIDLRRLLTLEDFVTDTRTVVGYSDHLQPNYPNDPDADDPENYEEYSVADHSYFVGEKAYDALRMVLDTGMMPERGYAGLQTLAAGGVVDREFSLVAGGGMLNPYWDAYWKLTPPNDFLAPSNYYSLFSGFGSGGGAGYAPGGGDISSGLGRPFGLDSLFDLLVFNGVNDDTFRSPLEVALSGRADPDAITPLELAARFGPLRDNRSTDLERTRGEWLGGPGGGYLFYDQAKAALYTDNRHRLTTHSGDRPITPSRISANPTNTDQPNPADLPLDTNDTKRNIKNMLDAGQIQDIFRAYVDALLPYSAADQHWTDPVPRQSDTLYYGYRGPELALRTAAHMAVNLQDAYDGDDAKAPTARSLILVSGMPGFGNPEFRLDDDLLAPTIGDVYAPSVTVFGIEAQPFLTEVATFVMYTDTPFSAGGDEDGDIGGNGGLPTINGEIESGNPDFLFQCIAFQINNPFPFPVNLTEDAGQHYIRYGDFYYKLEAVDESGGQAPIILEARDSSTTDNGNTVVAYYMDPPPDIVAQRWAAVMGSTDEAERARLDDWIQNQLVGDPLDLSNINIVRIEAYTDNTFSTEVGDFQPGLLESAAENGIVELYRSDPNIVPSEVLVDRLRDPEGDGSLNRELVDENLEITDAGSDPEGIGNNRGLTITRHANVRRREDPQAGSSGTLTPPLGGLPAYCLESKSQTSFLNIEDKLDDSVNSGLKIGDFSSPKGGLTADEVISAQVDTELIETIRTAPEEKSGLPGNQIGDNLAMQPFAGGPSSPPLYVEPHLNNTRFEVNGISTMRVADLLLPLGIGPSYSSNPAEGWTTLSEALAIALYYENPPSTESVYSGVFVPPATNADPEVLLDRGSLQYTAFVPYFDANLDGIFNLADSDIRWGLGVPAAANLFDTFTTLPPKFGSITNLTHGQINVNTASREVLRSLPGLSPPSDVNPDSFPNWWWTNNTHDEHSDIATTLAAYRDRLAMFPRDVSGMEIDALDFRNWWVDPFDPFGGDSPPDPSVHFAPGSYDAEIGGDNGRWGATGVMGIHESPGLRSLGEIALVRNFGYNSINLGYDFPHDIDRLGFDGLDVDQPGIDSVSYGTGATPEDDQINDDYDERLALASAVMASSSVRSDIFAVWFLVHGYQESDVKGLGINDPLVPSVARRFVMVVDRSNVTKPGQKPRILLFKEVPL